MKYIVLVFSLSLLISVVSTGDPITAVSQIENNEDRETPGGATQTTDEPVSKVQESTPQAGDLTEKTLGESFRNFVPSELISSDNAVPFPVDI